MTIEQYKTVKTIYGTVVQLIRPITASNSTTIVAYMVKPRDSSSIRPCDVKDLILTENILEEDTKHLEKTTKVEKPEPVIAESFKLPAMPNNGIDIPAIIKQKEEPEMKKVKEEKPKRTRRTKAQMAEARAAVTAVQATPLTTPAVTLPTTPVVPMVVAPVPAPEPISTPPVVAVNPETGKPKRIRRTKAQMAEARAAEAAGRVVQAVASAISAVTPPVTPVPTESVTIPAPYKTEIIPAVPQPMLDVPVIKGKRGRKPNPNKPIKVKGKRGRPVGWRKADSVKKQKKVKGNRGRPAGSKNKQLITAKPAKVKGKRGRPVGWRKNKN